MTEDKKKKSKQKGKEKVEKNVQSAKVEKEEALEKLKKLSDAETEKVTGGSMDGGDSFDSYGDFY